MLKRRIFALALATALFMQSLGTSAYAAGQSEVSQTTDETVVADTTEADTTEVMPEEASDEEVTSEEITTEVVTNEEITTEEVTTQEAITEEVTTEETTSEEVATEEVVGEEITTEQMTEETVLEDSVLESSGNYVVDDTLGHKIFVNATVPGSYNVQIKARYNKNGSSLDALSQETLYLVYTDNTTLSEAFYPDVTYVDEETITAAGYKAISSDEFVKTDVDDWWSYRINATFCGTEGLKPATQYTYRLACRKADDSAAGGYRYYFITVPQDFTTEAAITASSVSFNNIEVESGYHHARILFEVDANGESLLDVTTGNQTKYILKYIPASENDFSNAEEVNVSQYFDNDLGYNIEGVYSAKIKSLDGDVKARLETAVFTGDRVKTTVASEEIDIKFKDFSEADITVTEKALSSAYEFTIDINPWYEGDEVYDGYVIDLYTKTGEEDWKRTGYVWVDSARSYLLAKGLTEKTTYQYYMVIDASVIK